MNYLSIKEIQSELLKVAKLFHAFCEENHIDYYLIGGSALGAIRHNGFIPWDDDIDVGMTRENYDRFLSEFPKKTEKYELKNFSNDEFAHYCLTRIYIDDVLIEYPKEFKKIADKRLYFDIFPLDDCPDTLREIAAHSRKIKMMKNILNLKSHLPQNVLKRIVSWLIIHFIFPFRTSHYAKKMDRLLKKHHKSKHFFVCSMASQYPYYKQLFAFKVYGVPQKHVFEDTVMYVPQYYDIYLTQLFGDDYSAVPPIEKRRSGYKMFRITEDKNAKN